MPNVTWRRNGELLHALFDVLNEQPDGLPASEALRAVEARVTLTPHEAGDYSDGTRRFEKIVRFATITTGWLVKERGRWTLTELGRQGRRKHRDPEEFVRRS